jgi:hypothetical protein
MRQNGDHPLKRRLVGLSPVAMKETGYAAHRITRSSPVRAVRGV